MKDTIDRSTGDLVSVLLDGTGASSAGALAVAGAVEAGELAALGPGGNICRRPDLPLAATRRLTAALELARRASLAPTPAALRSPRDVAAIALRELGGLRRERVLAIACDSGNRVIGTEVVAVGGADRCAFPVREILAAVLRVDGRALALAHNHPGGEHDPSSSDIAATERVAAAARCVGVRFLVHVVVVGVGGWATVVTPGLRTLGSASRVGAQRDTPDWSRACVEGARPSRSTPQ